VVEAGVMKFVTVGQTPDGRSTVAEVVEQDWTPPEGELLSIQLWAGEELATRFADRERRAPLRPQQCPPGAGSWKLVRFAAGAAAPMHRTDTLDCDTVISGIVELILEVGSVQLEAGDTVLLPGLAHGWASPQGGTMSAMLYGIEP
jgi:hypothetical protein